MKIIVKDTAGQKLGSFSANHWSKTVAEVAVGIAELHATHSPEFDPSREAVIDEVWNRISAYSSLTVTVNVYQGGFSNWRMTA